MIGISVSFYQSNHEGALVDRIHALADTGTEGFIVNFAAYSHTSIALHDALKSVGLPAIEVHISDIKKREPFRRRSMTAGACIAMISGKGFPGYVEALLRLARL
jgi:3-dehydroquinate dehydratase-2